MLRVLSNIKLVYKTLGLFIAILVAVFIFSKMMILSTVQKASESEVIANQNKNIKAAALVFEKQLPQFKVDMSKQGGINQLTLSEIPSFDNHDIIDEIGLITGETATLFIWDEETQDFWRKTTNIIKDDGSRAVGTPLGKDGSVYPYLVAGEKYLGEAVILGKPYFTRYDPIFIEGSDKPVGILYVGLEKEKFDQYLVSLTNEFLIIGSISILVAVIIILALYNIIFTRPINQTIAQIQNLANGEKEFEILLQDRGDEIGDINRALKVFQASALEAEKLALENEAAEKRAAEERKQAMLDMADHFEKSVSVVVNNVEKAASDMQEMASLLGAVIQKTSEKSSAVSAASQEATTNVQTVAAAAEEMSASIREISKNIAETAKNSKICASTAEKSQEKLQHLQQAVGDIDSVIQAINDVAEQTNLLALNATIEAARAGEAGKGFAVVAGEVKTLASETHKMTEEISRKVSDIKESAADTIASVSDIISQISSVDEKTGSVAASIEEQNATTTEISRNVQEAAIGTNEVSKSIEDVQQSANESAQSVEQLHLASDGLAQQASELKQSVESFLKEVRSA